MKPCDAVQTPCGHSGSCYGRVYWEGLSFENKKGCRKQQTNELETCPHEERLERWWMQCGCKHEVTVDKLPKVATLKWLEEVMQEEKERCK